MTSFFAALDPTSSNSSITFRATEHAYAENILQQDIPDLTLDLVIPFLWSRNLSIFEGIYETFTVFYGDHFDINARGFGQKGVLDFTFLPLLSRKLIADTYLEEQKDSQIFNFIAWSIALPIKAINFGIALAFTIALIPIVIGATLLRYLFSDSLPPPPPPSPPCDTGGAVAMILSTQTAYAALYVALRRLELAGILTPENIRHFLAEPQNLALVYAMEYLTHVVDENGVRVENQVIFNFLIEHRAFWTDVRVIGNLNNLHPLNQPFIRFDQLQREARRPAAVIAQEFNGRQSTHTASVHTSTSQSAARLQQQYSSSSTKFNTDLDISTAKMVRSYDKKLVGQHTDQEILDILNAAINRLSSSTYTDPTSHVSSRSLLQYGWAAAHDSSQWREGVTQETADACFYASLYEAEREYALSDSGEDNGRSGSCRSCEGGAFNKIVEGMAKTHKLCEVNFITPATAALKLPCVVRQVLKAHLAENPAALEQLKSEGLSALWPELQSGVLEVMQRDFLAIYPSTNGQINASLLALVEAGEYTDLTQELSLLEQESQQNTATDQAYKPMIMRMIG